MTIINFIYIFIVVSSQQLITHPGKLVLPLKLKIIGFFLQLVFYPLGFLKSPNKSFGQRLTTCFEKLGPIYIKFGQTLSTRPDLVGIEVANELKYLQDRLPPFNSSLVKQIIYKAFGQSVNELFIEFDNIPVAAASIAQVHKARLKTGEFVAVKILRPDIHKKYDEDIRLLYLLSKFAKKYFKRMKRLKLIEVIDIFKFTMHQELDLRLEAAASSEMTDNFKSDNTVYIPTIYWQLTHENILTSEWVDGISIYDTEKLKSKRLDPDAISKKIAVMFFNQAYRDGFFHADLHPGNILVKDNGSIVLLDFGIMGRLKEKDRLAIAGILAGFLKRDYKTVAEIHVRVGYVPKNTDPEIFAQSCRAVCEPIIGLPIKDISIGKLLTQLFKITEDFGMETQPQLLLLQKTMVVVEGIGQSLDPNINMWELARPWIKKWGAKNLSPEAKMIRIFKKMLNDFYEKNYKEI